MSPALAAVEESINGAVELNQKTVFSPVSATEIRRSNKHLVSSSIG
jgi:hypothetical protein